VRRLLPALALWPLLLALALASPAAPAQAQTVPAPEGFRMGDYRAPTPAELPGAATLDTPGAASLWRQGGAAWFDVLPAARRPEGLPEGSLWRPTPRLGVPGSLWLPEAGRGRLDPALESWFRGALDRATGGDRGRPVVFYCRADCWMSWNAARRALGWGWRDVRWYRDGTDGWEAAGLPTEVLQPAPGMP
jgi:PQQ-dependent catabolism-associated CXXCW motif protein